MRLNFPASAAAVAAVAAVALRVDDEEAGKRRSSFV